MRVRDRDDGVLALDAAGLAVGVLDGGDARQLADLLDGLADLDGDTPVGQRDAVLRVEDDGRGRAR